MNIGIEWRKIYTKKDTDCPVVSYQLSCNLVGSSFGLAPLIVNSG